MTEKVFARQLEGGLWQWRHVAEHGGWASEYYSTGDAEAVAESRSSSTVPVLVALGGQHVICREMEVEEKDKRHMAKLLPYEMEEFLIDNVDDMHFIFTPPVDNKTAVLYVKNESVENAIASLQELHCDIPTCLPDYLFLLRENNGATLIYEGDIIWAHLAEGKGFTIEANLAPVVLAGITQNLDSNNTLNLVAENDEKLEKLAAWVPILWREENGPEIKTSEGGYWDWVDPSVVAASFNLRRGRFARQLPFTRWLSDWKVPAIAAAIAFMLSVGVSFGQYISEKSHTKRIIAQIDEVYRQAVPGGKSRDPEGDLRSKVKSLGKKSEPSNFVVLFNSVTMAMQSAQNIKLSSIRYNADQRELQLNLEGKDFGTLESLRGKVNSAGFAAEFMRVDKQADMHNARMKVAEVKP